MIGLSKGQRVLDKFKSKGRLGSGILYLLNRGIAFEITGKGTAFELNYDEIKSAKEAKRNVLSVYWLEGETLHLSKFKTTDVKGIASKITNYQHGSHS